LGIISGKRAYRDGFFISDIRKYVSWITHDLLNTHKSNLIRKEIEKHNKYLEKYFVYTNGSDEEYNEKFYYYRSLWPWCNPDIKMHFNWRDK
jgi:hypothetical protein